MSLAPASAAGKCRVLPTGTAGGAIGNLYEATLALQGTPFAERRIALEELVQTAETLKAPVAVPEEGSIAAALHPARHESPQQHARHLVDGLRGVLGAAISPEILSVVSINDLESCAKVCTVHTVCTSFVSFCCSGDRSCAA